MCIPTLFIPTHKVNLIRNEINLNIEKKALDVRIRPNEGKHDNMKQDVSVKS